MQGGGAGPTHSSSRPPRRHAARTQSAVACWRFRAPAQPLVVFLHATQKTLTRCRGGGFGIRGGFGISIGTRLSAVCPGPGSDRDSRPPRRALHLPGHTQAGGRQVLASVGAGIAALVRSGGGVVPVYPRPRWVLTAAQSPHVQTCFVAPHGG